MKKTVGGIDQILYQSIHTWLHCRYGNANHCESKTCKKITTNYDWALKRGKKYERKLSNFIQLCRSCHRLYDYTEEIRQKSIATHQKYVKKPIICRQCGQFFKNPHISHQKQCSFKCFLEYRRLHYVKKHGYVTCICGKMVYERRKSTKFCSKSCSMKYMRNKSKYGIIQNLTNKE